MFTMIHFIILGLHEKSTTPSTTTKETSSIAFIFSYAGSYSCSCFYIRWSFYLCGYSIFHVDSLKSSFTLHLYCLHLLQHWLNCVENLLYSSRERVVLGLVVFRQDKIAQNSRFNILSLVYKYLSLCVVLC
ncbi:hypothetical protein KFK09_017125 [Dendrobium nobile]|uniref:Uncharacterized protein n=1 Tax=Dendrobium nobile TaxID=94219 RepID=A0A8T3B239_DENNO|nr:hypothetical protein KFK09_017125 [Dendrobium nobile]